MLSAHQMKRAGDVYSAGEMAAGEELDEDFLAQFSFCDELLNRMYKFMEVVQTTFQQLHIQGTYRLYFKKIHSALLNEEDQTSTTNKHNMHQNAESLTAKG